MRQRLIGSRREWSIPVLLLSLIQPLSWSDAVAQPSVCPEESYSLTTQAEVDAFPKGCSEITGDLTIGPSEDITDLSSFSELTVVDGYLIVEFNDALTNLDGLSSITSVGEGCVTLSLPSGVVCVGVWIRSNAALENIDGLSGLVSVGEGCDDVSPPSGLPCAGVRISGNSALTNLDGLSGLVAIEGGVSIEDNDVLSDVNGLSGHTSLPWLTISDNATLSDVDGLSELTSLEGDLTIEFNSTLANLDGFSALTSIDGGLTITFNPVLTNLSGFSALTSVGRYLWIWYNDALTDVDGLSALLTVGEGISISNHSALVDLDGLSALTSVGGTLSIEDNPVLTNVNGLSGITSVGGDLRIDDNNELSYCSCGLYACVSGECVAGTITMANNAPSGDCNNDGADLVANACVAPSAVTLLLPDNRATEVAAYTTFSWQPLDGAAAYHLQVAGDAGSKSMVVDDSTLSEASFMVSEPLAYSTGYYWHVRAALDDGLGKTTGLLFGPWSETRSFTVAVGTATEGATDLPTVFALHPNYPNPFNPSTKITYDVAEATVVRVAVFDALGRLVEVLSTKYQVPGAYAVTWQPRALPSGVYFVRMQAGNFTKTRRLILAK